MPHHNRRDPGKPQIRDHSIEAYALKMSLRALGVLVLIAIVGYPADWLIWRSRVAAGTGMGSVRVEMFTVAELKGGKEDIYPNGTAMIACSRSLYPQSGNKPCWWVRRHPEVMQRY